MTDTPKVELPAENEPLGDEMVVSLDKTTVLQMLCSHLATVYSTDRHPKAVRLHDITVQLGNLTQKLLAPRSVPPQSWENEAARLGALVMALLMDGDDSIPWSLPEAREEWRDHFQQIEAMKSKVTQRQRSLEATLTPKSPDKGSEKTPKETPDDDPGPESA